MDVFLSFKNTDAEGNVTKDKEMAEELYQALVDKGIAVFFSPQTLAELGASQFKEAIDEALDAATVLVAVGTSAENLNSNWVKYEWDGFCEDVLGGRKQGSLLSYIDDMSQGDLPRSLRVNQSFRKSESNLDEICEFILRALGQGSLGANTQEAGPYRILSMREIEAEGIAPAEIALAITQNDQNLYDGIPDECAGTPEQWASVYHRYPDYCEFVLDEKKIVVGNYGLIGLTSEQEEEMKKGKLREDTLQPDKLENIYNAGVHSAFLLNLSVNPSDYAVEMYQDLWQSFIDMLKSSAVNRQSFFSKIYYKVFLPEHETMAVAHGFTYLCGDEAFGRVFVHDMDPETTLGLLDEGLAEIYEKNGVSGKRKRRKDKKTEMEALSAHADLWRKIDELFYRPRIGRLKRYFVEDGGIPRRDEEFQVGLAVADWLCDILRYSATLMPFLPEDQKKLHSHFERRVMGSDLVKASMQKRPRAFIGFDVHHDDEELQSVSIDSIVAFANIWLEIDELFMTNELAPLRKYFYDQGDVLPEEDCLELCEGLAVRLLSGIKDSEALVRRLPEDTVYEFYDDIDIILSSCIVQRVCEKYPFLWREVMRG